MTTKFRTTVIALFTLTCVWSIIVPPAARASWSTGTIINTDSTANNWMVLDSSGNPHMAYRNITRAMVYAWAINDAWSSEVADSDTNMYDPVIGLNQLNEPRLVYVHRYASGAADEGMVYYNKKTGASWGGATAVTAQTNYMDLGGFYRKDLDLFRVVFFKKTTLSGGAMAELHYSSQTSNTSWGGSNVTLDTNGATGFGTAAAASIDYDSTSIFRSSSGTLHIAYYDRSASGPRIRYMTVNEDGTSPGTPETITTTVNTGGTYRFQVGLMVDNNNVIHAAWSSGATNPYDMRYASNTGSGWSVEVASAAVGYGLGHVHITTDTAGHPLIAFERQWDTAHGQAVFTHKVCGSWKLWMAPRTDAVDSDEGYAPKIAVSSTGVHHLVHGRAAVGGASSAQIHHVWVDSYTPTAVTDLTHNWSSGLNIPLTWKSPPDKDADNNNQNLPDGSIFRVMYTASAAKAAGTWDPNTTDSDFTKVDTSTGCLAPDTDISTTIPVPSQGTYYLRVFTRDEYLDNWSPVSNGTTVQMGATLALATNDTYNPSGHGINAYSENLIAAFTLTGTYESIDIDSFTVTFAAGGTATLGLDFTKFRIYKETNDPPNGWSDSDGTDKLLQSGDGWVNITGTSPTDYHTSGSYTALGPGTSTYYLTVFSAPAPILSDNEGISVSMTPAPKVYGTATGSVNNTGTYSGNNIYYLSTPNEPVAADSSNVLRLGSDRHTFFDGANYWLFYLEMNGSTNADVKFKTTTNSANWSGAATKVNTVSSGFSSLGVWEDGTYAYVTYSDGILTFVKKITIATKTLGTEYPIPTSGNYHPQLIKDSNGLLWRKGENR